MTEHKELAYWDGRHYDAQSQVYARDIPFYVRQAQNCGSPILEVACGTGRITIPVAQVVEHVTGLDISEAMLRQARCKADERKLDIEWIEADCRDFDLGKKFNLIIFPFNAICYLHDLHSYEAFFKCVKQHLAPDGRFILDVFNPALNYLVRESNKQHHIADYLAEYPEADGSGVVNYPISEYLSEFPDPTGTDMINVTESSTYNTATQISTIKLHYTKGTKKWVTEKLLRNLFPQELDLLLHYNGFDIEEKFGDFTESPFTSTSRTQVCVCRLQST